jgi:hypothetical protein
VVVQTAGKQALKRFKLTRSEYQRQARDLRELQRSHTASCGRGMAPRSTCGAQELLPLRLPRATSANMACRTLRGQSRYTTHHF